MPKKSKRARSGRKYPRRAYWIEQRDKAFERAGYLCEISGDKLGYWGLGPGIWIWRRACDHIIPERAVRRYCKGADPHILMNLKVVTPSLHSRKTAIEYLIFRWDIVGYKRELNRLGFNPLLFDEAWKALCASIKSPAKS
jgi:hypothetical protein